MVRLSVTGIVAAVIAGIACSAAAAPEKTVPLVQESTITLANVSGRIDHLAVDLARKHLFVAELGNNSVDAIDLTTQKVIHRISGLDEPQGIAYLPQGDIIVVANGGDGAVRF